MQHKNKKNTFIKDGIKITTKWFIAIFLIVIFFVSLFLFIQRCMLTIWLLEKRNVHMYTFMYGYTYSSPLVCRRHVSRHQTDVWNHG